MRKRLFPLCTWAAESCDLPQRDTGPNYWTDYSYCSCRMRLVGSGSDYEYFLQVLGIPSLEPRFTYDSVRFNRSLVNLCCLPSHINATVAA